MKKSKQTPSLEQVVADAPKKLAECFAKAFADAESDIFNNARHDIRNFLSESLSGLLSGDVKRVAAARAQENLAELEPDIMKAVDEAMGEAFREELLSSIKIGGKIQIIVQVNVEGRP